MLHCTVRDFKAIFEFGDEPPRMIWPDGLIPDAISKRKRLSSERFQTPCLNDLNATLLFNTCDIMEVMGGLSI